MYYWQSVKESLLFVDLLPRASTLLVFLNANVKEFDGNLDKRAIRWRGVCRRRAELLLLMNSARTRFGRSAKENCFSIISQT